MNTPINVGLLAYGMSGKVFHAPFLHVHPGFNLYAVTERSKKLASKDYPSIKSYDSIQELIADPIIDLVVINTPNYLHYEHTKAALLAKKHVLVEKPFTSTSLEAKELFDLAHKNQCKIMVYQNRRYSSDFLSVKEILKSGVLGDLIELNFRFDRFKNQIGPKKFKEEPYPASGILYDLGAHLLDQIICLLGKPVKFFKTSGKFRPNSEVPDFGHLHLIYPNNTHAFITVSMLAAAPVPGIVIHGTKGSFIKPFSDVQENQSIAGILPDNPLFGIEEQGKEGQLTTITEDGKFVQNTIPGVKGNMLGIFDAVYQTIQNNQPFPITKEDVLIQLEILEKEDN